VATNLNVWTGTGNLTKDPELRTLPSGGSVCTLRIAVNSRRKEGEEWVEKPNYFDVSVWGAQGENCARYLSKGRPVGVSGELEWREWQDAEGNTRQATQIKAHVVQFLGSAQDGGSAPAGDDGPAF
jgi:single-strand DNA-binding protein